LAEDGAAEEREGKKAAKTLGQKSAKKVNRRAGVDSDITR
jgi:hypothetical protein